MIVIDSEERLREIVLPVLRELTRGAEPAELHGPLEPLPRGVRAHLRRLVGLIAAKPAIETLLRAAENLDLRDLNKISTRLDRQLRAEAANLARLRTPGARWGRPAAVDPLELLAWWEGRGGRRPLSLRDLARKFGISEATTRKHLGALRAVGELDGEARTRALGARGGHRKDGRPANPLDDDALAAVWRKTPSITAVTRALNVSGSRVPVRLQETGLIKSSRPL